MDTDNFYDKLPYTLNEDQLNPDFVIFGTGLQECLLAAYKTKTSGQKGLIIDTDKTYGSSLKTLTFKQLHELTSLKSTQKMYEFVGEVKNQANQGYYDWCIQNKKFRGFSIDIQPNLFFGSSVTCQSLKDAEMDKYMDFHLINNIIHIHNNSFIPVPLSKGKIFQSVELTMIQKKNLLMALHKLIKIYHKYMNLQQDVNSTKQFDKGFGEIQQNLYNQFLQKLDQYFLPFIMKLTKKSKKIINYLAYIICNYQYNFDQIIPQYAKSLYTLKGFITKFGKFIKSCGIYGESPYLYVDNGIGDLPQAFSRIASIYGSTYILHPKITVNSIQKVDSDYLIATNLSPQKPIITKQVFFGPTHLSLIKTQQQYYQQKILRVLLICEKHGKQQRCPAICFIPELQSFKNPIYLFLFDQSTQSCPKGLIIYQFQTILSHKDDMSLEGCRIKSHKLLSQLKNIYGEIFEPSIKYSTVYLRTRKYPKHQTVNETALSLHDTMGIDLDQHFNNFINIVGNKQNYFKKINTEGQQQDDQPIGGYQTNYLLQQLQQIDITQKTQDIIMVKSQQNKTISNIQEKAAAPLPEDKTESNLTKHQQKQQNQTISNIDMPLQQSIQKQNNQPSSS